MTRRGSADPDDEGPDDGSQDDEGPDDGSQDDDGPDDVVALGVAFLAAMADEDCSLGTIMDRLDGAVTGEPRLQRAIIETAERRGVIERDRETATVVPTARRRSFDADRDVVVKAGSFTCSRCGQSIDPGRFLDLDVGDVGPYGPVCVEYALGIRDEDGDSDDRAA